MPQVEYDLASKTIYHKLLTNEELYNATRQQGIALPRAKMSPPQPPYAGVYFSGGHPTWPLFTVKMNNEQNWLPEHGWEGVCDSATWPNCVCRWFGK